MVGAQCVLQCVLQTMVKCIDCGGGATGEVKWGRLENRLNKWCKPCGIKHGAVDLRLCMDCGLKNRSFGLPEDRKKRWCAPCGKLHPGSFNVKVQLCEDCGDTNRCFGMPEERKKRWCGDCATKHSAAINLNSKMCQLCGEGPAGYGHAPAEGEPKVAMWCIKCKEGQTGTIIRVYAVRRPCLPRRCCSLPPHNTPPPPGSAP